MDLKYQTFICNFFLHIMSSMFIVKSRMKRFTGKLNLHSSLLFKVAQRQLKTTIENWTNEKIEDFLSNKKMSSSLVGRWKSKWKSVTSSTYNIYYQLRIDILKLNDILFGKLNYISSLWCPLIRLDKHSVHFDVDYGVFLFFKFWWNLIERKYSNMWSRNEVQS